MTRRLLLVLAHLFGKAFVVGQFGDKRGYRRPKEVGDFRACHVLILHRVVQQCCDDDVRTPVGGLCNQTGDFDQMVEVRLRSSPFRFWLVCLRAAKSAALMIATMSFMHTPAVRTLTLR